MLTTYMKGCAAERSEGPCILKCRPRNTITSAQPCQKPNTPAVINHHGQTGQESRDGLLCLMVSKSRLDFCLCLRTAPCPNRLPSSECSLGLKSCCCARSTCCLMCCSALELLWLPKPSRAHLLGEASADLQQQCHSDAGVWLSAPGGICTAAHGDACPDPLEIYNKGTRATACCTSAIHLPGIWETRRSCSCRSVQLPEIVCLHRSSVLLCYLQSQGIAGTSLIRQLHGQGQARLLLRSKLPKL